jgi:poly(A) polymerase
MIPELSVCKGIPQPADYHHEGDVWDHTLQVAKSFTDEHGPDVRLAAMFHDCGKAITFSLKERIRFDEHAVKSAELATVALKRMQCPRKRIEKIDWLIRHHMMMGTFAELSEDRKAHWYFHPWFTELLQIFWLDVAGTTPSNFSLYEAILKDRNQFLDSHPKPEKPLLSGDEVMKILGVKPGAKVGEALQALHTAQVKKEVRNKAEAKVFVEKLK